jgi:serine/threonine protein kinase
MQGDLAHANEEGWPARTHDATLRAGQLIDGKYRVKHLLGEGGMAAVWAGTNERTGKRVALKVIRKDLTTTPGAELLFRCEGVAASRVDHPNVVTVFDVIEHEGVACMVMEMLDGEPLGSYIARNGPLSVAEATRLLLPAMRGAAAAHGQGVIHRDIKPQNIFVCIGPDGRAVTAKVLDFGISIMGERARERSAGAVSGLMGTPGYMSPELIEGVAEVDERTDVYGFGVVLYEALSGQAPFPGDMGSDLLRRVLNEPPPPLERLCPDLSPGLVAIIETAMAKDPDRRFANMNLMVSALEDEVMSVTPPPRLTTPVAGIPVAAMSPPPSGQVAGVVLTLAKREPSGEHQETRVFFGHPLELEDDRNLPDGQDHAGGDRQWKAVGSSLPPSDAAATGAPGPPLATSLGPGGDTASLSSIVVSPNARRRRRGLAGAAFVVVLLVEIWMAIQGTSRMGGGAPVEVARAAPPARGPVAAPPVPAFARSPDISAAPVVAPAAPLSSTPTPRTLVMFGTENERTTDYLPHAAATPGHVRVAIRRASPDPQPRRSSARGGLWGDRRAPNAGASARATAPRAGGLSVDDFF